MRILLEREIDVSLNRIKLDYQKASINSDEILKSLI